jgi:putative DNA primase/helicase
MGDEFDELREARGGYGGGGGTSDWTPQLEPGQHNNKTIRIIKGEIARIVDEAEAALLAVADVVPIMVRAGMLVQPIVDRLPASHDRMTDVTLLKPLTNANIIYLLNKYAATFEQYNGRSKKWLVVDPPSNVATQLLEKGQWRFPKVAGVITAPTLRPDGSILDRPGYDPATQLWYAPDGALTMPTCKNSPSREDAERALKLLDDLLSGFPFVSDVDRSVALAALLTSVLRGALDVTPMPLFRAHDVGSGKSLLADLMSTVARGLPCPVITNSQSVEEMEKRLGALVLEGVPMVSLDNCSSNIGGDLLCQMTERPLVRIRILGRSEMPECEWRGVLLGTGNNIAFADDMTRRGLIANLDPQCERPELRTFGFDPIERVLNDRGAYIVAAITIARAYFAANCPQVCKTPLGSYSRWSKVVRSPLVWLGRADPVASMEQARQEDPGRRALHTLIELWRDNFALNLPYTASELVFRANELANPIGEHGEPEPEPQTELRELLLQQAGTPRGDISTKALGNWLMSVHGRVYSGMRIELVKESRAHGNKYALVEVT